MAYTKDPDAFLDYEVDWTAWLDGDTIASSAWVVPAGITKASESHTTTSAKAWFQGGTVGTTYTVTNRITTTGGRIDDRSIKLAVRER